MIRLSAKIFAGLSMFDLTERKGTIMKNYAKKRESDKRKGVWYTLLCCFFLCLFCAKTVRADLIWEPMDSFYEKHVSECTYVNRLFTADGPDGEVIVYKSPVSSSVITRLKNGTRLYVSFSYEASDGIEWAVYEDSGTGDTGWMPMDYLTVVYDSISFEEEFGEQIDTSGYGSLDDSCCGTDVYFWNYPGSTESTVITVSDYAPEYSGTFVDEEGQKWGKVSYYMGLKSFWICLDNPSADFDALYPNGVPSRGSNLNSADRTPEKIVPNRSGTAKTLIFVTVMVLLVVLVTVVLLVILKDRKKE